MPGRPFARPVSSTAVLGRPLSAKEIDVLRLAALRTKEISKRLASTRTRGSSESSVKMHLDSAMAKLGVSTRASALVVAIRQGTIALADVVTA